MVNYTKFTEFKKVAIDYIKKDYNHVQMAYLSNLSMNCPRSYILLFISEVEIELKEYLDRKLESKEELFDTKNEENKNKYIIIKDSTRYKKYLNSLNLLEEDSLPRVQLIEFSNWKKENYNAPVFPIKIKEESKKESSTLGTLLQIDNTFNKLLDQPDIKNEVLSKLPKIADDKVYKVRKWQELLVENLILLREGDLAVDPGLKKIRTTVYLTQRISKLLKRLTETGDNNPFSGIPKSNLMNLAILLLVKNYTSIIDDYNFELESSKLEILRDNRL